MGVPIEENRDRHIAAETLVSNVNNMVTSNMGSINHTLFNQWGKEQYGLNENFIYSPDAFVQYALGNNLGEAVHQIAINMTLSHKERSGAEYKSSLNNFIRNLHATMPFCSNAIDLQERHSSSRDIRWKEGHEMIREASWATARAVEDKRIARMREARKAISRL